MSALRLAPAVFLVLFVVSCSKPTASEVPGRYQANRGYGVESLHLRPDGSYDQVFTSATTNRTNSGRWKFDNERPQVFLYDALIFDDGFGRPASLVETSVWAVRVEKFAGQISLPFGESESFKKQKP